MKHCEELMCIALTVHSSFTFCKDREVEERPCVRSLYAFVADAHERLGKYLTNTLPFVVETLHVEAGSMRREAATSLCVASSHMPIRCMCLYLPCKAYIAAQGGMI